MFNIPPLVKAIALKAAWPSERKMLFITKQEQIIGAPTKIHFA